MYIKTPKDRRHDDLHVPSFFGVAVYLKYIYIYTCRYTKLLGIEFLNVTPVYGCPILKWLKTIPTGWYLPVISWFITPSKYSYKVSYTIVIIVMNQLS
jgi:hypothetical protein